MSIDDRALDPDTARSGGQPIGQYRIDLATDTWWWSTQAYKIHGFTPGEVVPTTELVLAHKHPDDREHVREIFTHARKSGGPFSSVHRIMDARGRERCLVLIGHGRRDPETSDLVEIVGYFVDITSMVARRASERADDEIAEAAAGRGPIEQAKGIIIIVYGVDADEAFRRLRRASNNKNVRIQDLARVIVDEAERSGPDCAEHIDSILH